MPFYFRIPLPGPFGFSHRIGGSKRSSKPTYTHKGCPIHHSRQDLAEKCGAKMPGTGVPCQVDNLLRTLDGGVDERTGCTSKSNSTVTMDGIKVRVCPKHSEIISRDGFCLMDLLTPAQQAAVRAAAAGVPCQVDDIAEWLGSDTRLNCTSESGGRVTIGDIEFRTCPEHTLMMSSIFES